MESIRTPRLPRNIRVLLDKARLDLALKHWHSARQKSQEAYQQRKQAIPLKRKNKK